MLSRAPSHVIEPWRSKTDTVVGRRGPSLGSPTVWALVGMMAVLAGIAPWIQVDRIVTSTRGRIVATEAVRTFQALDPSIIRTVDVKEGEEVGAGRLLATLDPTFADADAEGLRRQVGGLDALISRARAEQDGKPLALGTDAADPDPYPMLQQRLFGSRAAQLRAQILSFDEKVAAAKAAITRIEADQVHVEDREKIARQIEGMRDTLYKSGSSSLLNLLQASDAHLELERSVENNRNSLAELHQQVAGLQSDREAAVQQWYAASSQELVTAETQRDAARASLDKAVRHADLVRLTASKPSVVLTLTELSAGSVLKEGDPVLTLMPLDAPIKAEIAFSAADIGFVKPGDPVSLKLDAFNYAEHGTAQGRIDWISPGAFKTDESDKPTAPYYKARVTVEAVNLINLPAGFRLIPGMTLVADINTGRRSLAGSVLGVLVHGLGEALREP